jgi:outer membrane protein OmpA-like peptidoglycan-associated protein
MKTLSFLIALAALSAAVSPAQPLGAQNLVANPSFELIDGPEAALIPCAFFKQDAQFNRAVRAWNTFSDQTPDLITYDDSLAACRLVPVPAEGRRMAGIFTYFPRASYGPDQDYHEFMQGQLMAPMQAGTRYTVSFLVSQDHGAAAEHLKEIFGPRQKVTSLAANNLGVLFVVNPFRPTEDFRASIRNFGLRPQLKTEGLITTAAGEWQRFSFSFTADQPYRYFVIGNFSPDSETTTDLAEKVAAGNTPPRPNIFHKHIAYYWLDDFSITPGPPPAAMAAALESEGVYAFRAVHFATGKAELPPAAYTELQELAQWLRDRPQQRVEIAGHTDNVGQPAANQALSEQRAKAVFDYLRQQGIPAHRLSYRGYGDAQPVADNAQPSGRQMNRRVECRLLE